MKTTEKLPDNLGGKDVEVEWEIGDRYDEAGDGHVFMHAAEGFAAEGYLFIASASICDGEFIEIDDVEFNGFDETHEQFRPKEK